MQIDAPPPPGPGEVQLRVQAVGLNHIDVWGFRGMAFAKRLYPLTVGAEAACEVVAVGEGVTNVRTGRPRRAVLGADLRHLPAVPCSGRDNLCENVAGVRGFHVDGFAQDLTNHPARLLVKVPDGVSTARRRLRRRSPTPPSSTCCSTTPTWNPARWILVHAGGSGIGTHRHPHRQVDRLHRHHHRRVGATRPKRPRRWAPTTSSTTARTGSRAWSAS